jgi:hypothetical protein
MVYSGNYGVILIRVMCLKQMERDREVLSLMPLQLKCSVRVLSESPSRHLITSAHTLFRRDEGAVPPERSQHTDNPDLFIFGEKKRKSAPKSVEIAHALSSHSAKVDSSDILLHSLCI